MPKIDIVSSFCWRGLYIDGVLVYDDESIPAWKLMDLLKIPYNTIHLDRHNSDEELPLELDDLLTRNDENE